MAVTIALVVIVTIHTSETECDFGGLKRRNTKYVFVNIFEVRTSRSRCFYFFGFRHETAVCIIDQRDGDGCECDGGGSDDNGKKYIYLKKIKKDLRARKRCGTNGEKFRIQKPFATVNNGCPAKCLTENFVPSRRRLIKYIKDRVVLCWCGGRGEYTAVRRNHSVYVLGPGVGKIRKTRKKKLRTDVGFSLKTRKRIPVCKTVPIICICCTVTVK